MLESFNLVQMVQGVVLYPGLASFFPLALFSFINEILAFFPYALVLAGQLLFLRGPFDIALTAKLLVYVGVPVGLGGSLGALPLYALAYFGGKPTINKFKKYLRFSWDDVERINQRFKGEWYDEAVFLLLRSIPLVPAFPVSIAGGILRMRFLPFFVLTTVGFIIKVMITLLIVGMGVHGLSQL